MEKRVLIVEDEPSIVTLIQYNLNQAGFYTDVAYNGEDAIKIIRKHVYDIVILDLMLPKIDGIEVCKTIRQEQNKVPVLMLTAKDSEYDKIQGLEIGADDYLTKPFSPKELIARIKAILRRTGDTHSAEKSIKVGELTIYPERFEVYFANQSLELKRKEFELLHYLLRHKNQIISREALLKAVWNYDFIGDSRTVDVQISNLRDKIEPNPKQPIYLKTVRGFGYKLEGPE